jgi:hypothetical protein
MIIIKNPRACAGISCSLMAALISSAHADAQTTNSATVPAPLQTWHKPAWLTDLSLAARESYDDNLLLVSGHGLSPEYSWITTFSPKIGVNFAQLLGADSPIKALTLLYAPDINIYHDAPQESYDAQRVIDFIKEVDGNFSFTLTNSFLYNNGSVTAPTYAQSQAVGGNTNDRFRNFFAFAAPRERRDQYQERGTASWQYNVDQAFIRATVSTIYYDLNTTFHNATAAPYIGYQNWPDRYDLNGGADLGYKIFPGLAFTIGYRYGYQYQQQFPLYISADQHFSSNDYQRLLLGVEGNPLSWLTIRLQAGPDFRNYNSMAPVYDHHGIFPFVDASVTASLTPNQTLTFTTREWQWLASTGLVPYFDSSYLLTYHWNATKELGLDLSGRIVQADFTSGNDFAGTAPSERNDIEYSVAAGASYAFTPNLSANVSYNFNLGRNLMNLPSTLAPDYRNFSEDIASVGVQYKF